MLDDDRHLTILERIIITRVTPYHTAVVGCQSQEMVIIFEMILDENDFFFLIIIT